MEKIYIIIHFTLCFFVDLENFGHEKEAEEEMEEEEEKADAAVEDATLEDVVEFTEDTGPRLGTLMNISPKKIQTRFSLNFANILCSELYTISKYDFDNDKVTLYPHTRLKW